MRVSGTVTTDRVPGAARTTSGGCDQSTVFSKHATQNRNASPTGGRPGSLMFGFLEEEIVQLETFYREHCAHYPGGTWGQVLVVGAKLPLLVLAISFFLTLYDRTVTHCVFGLGLLLTGFVNGIVAAADSSLHSEDPECSIRLTGRPSEGAAVLWFVWAWWCADVTNHPRRSMLVHGALLTLLAVWGSYADVRLGRCTGTETALGGAEGVVCAILMHLVATQSKAVRWLATWCGVGALLHK